MLAQNIETLEQLGTSDRKQYVQLYMWLHVLLPISLRKADGATQSNTGATAPSPFRLREEGVPP